MALGETGATETDLADVRLSTVVQVHSDASNIAAAGIACSGIARFEQHLNEKNRSAARLLLEASPRTLAANTELAGELGVGLFAVTDWMGRGGPARCASVSTARSTAAAREWGTGVRGSAKPMYVHRLGLTLC